VVYVDAGEGVVERRPVDAGVDQERIVAAIVEVGVHPTGRDAVVRERDAAHDEESGGDDFNDAGGIRHGFQGPSRGSDHVKGREWYQADDVAAEYEEKRFSRGGRLIDRREKRAVLDVLAPVEGREVLEIACGTGRFTVALAERDADVVGLDISAEMLAQGREKARRAGRSVEFLRGDAGRLPFPDDSFDAVFAMRFFHLADTPAAYLSEMARVAREQVFFDTFNAASARSVYNWALPMGSRLYSRGEVAGLFADVDLELRTADHDFVLPFGFYRQVPNRVADGVRDVDLAVGRTGVGSRLASVSYWDARVADGSGESEPF
jgi:Methylase involved in ubiquinone/menaquinone biosynthesis